MANAGRYTRFLAKEPAIRKQPELLLLTFFLASLPLYQANASLFARLAPAAGTLVRFAGQAAIVGALLGSLILLIGALHTKGWPGPKKTTTRVCTIAYAFTQTVLPVLLWIGFSSPAVIGVLALLGGALSAIVILEWVGHYAFDFRNIVFYGSLCCAASSLIIVALSALPAAVTLIAMPAMAIAGSIAPLAIPTQEHPSDWRIEQEGDPDIPPLSRRLLDLLSVEWLPLLGLVVLSLMMSIYELNIDGSYVKSECISGVIAAAIALVACFARSHTPLVTLLERFAVPLCAAICILLGSFPPGSTMFLAGAVSVYTPLVLISLLAIASAAAFVGAGEFSGALIVGVTLSLMSAVSAIGMLIAQSFQVSEMIARWSWTIACAFFVIVLIEEIVFTWRHLSPMISSVRDTETDLSENPAENAQTASTTIDVTAAAAATAEERLDHLATAHGLTARERELLGYLAHGYSSTYMAKELFISASTARTHTQHIYRKLGVNSREELLRLTELVTSGKDEEAADSQ